MYKFFSLAFIFIRQSCNRPKIYLIFLIQRLQGRNCSPLNFVLGNDYKVELKNISLSVYISITHTHQSIKYCIVKYEGRRTVK